ncbi:MAG: rubredoxin [Methanobacterium sp.]
MAGTYYCGVCGYIYSPERGEPRNNTASGTAFEDLPDLWRCPSCGAGKIRFRPKDR